MKYIIFGLLALLSAAHSYGQNYDTIRAGFYNSVNLIFPSKVLEWDMGLGVSVEGHIDVLVTSVGEKRLKLAAGIRKFRTTNLFVETEEAYYNFILVYSDNPKVQLIQVEQKQAVFLKEIKTNTELPQEADDTLSLAATSMSVYRLENDYMNIGEEMGDMIFYLGGIYTDGQYLFFKIYIRNNGNIPFDLGYLGFFDGTGRSGKRRPVQQVEMKPLYMNDLTLKHVGSGQLAAGVVVFRKFTLAKDHFLYIHIWEGNGGGRKVELAVRGKEILRARDF